MIWLLYNISVSPLGFPGFFRGFLVFSGFFKVFQGFSGFVRVFPGFSWFFLVSKVIVNGNLRLQSLLILCKTAHIDSGHIFLRTTSPADSSESGVSPQWVRTHSGLSESGLSPGYWSHTFLGGILRIIATTTRIMQGILEFSGFGAPCDRWSVPLLQRVFLVVNFAKSFFL